MNTARSKFEITGTDDIPDAAMTDEDAQKQALKAKWRELKAEFKPKKDAVESPISQVNVV
jgi:hypothetical protein